MYKRIRIGARPSTLAQLQADIVQKKIQNAFPECQIERLSIQSEGDKDWQRSLSELGGKGVFIRRLEEALGDNEIDIAVHSLKDVTTELLDGLTINACLAPESIQDCIVCREGVSAKSINELPKNARIATGSLRRRALLKKSRPDLMFIDIRGNVDTRLKKLEEGDSDAVILSQAGLIRLGLEEKISFSLDPTTFIPAPGQGVIAMETRQGDKEIVAICQAISDPAQTQISMMELNVLTSLGLGCGFPLGTYTKLVNKEVSMTLFAATPSLNSFFEKRIQFSQEDSKDALSAIKEELQNFLAR